LPPLLLKTSQPIDGCILKFSDDGELRLDDTSVMDGPKQFLAGGKGSIVLNPFSYATHEGVVQGMLRWTDVRRVSLLGLNSQDETDFSHYVLLSKEYAKIDEAVEDKRVEVIMHTSAGKKLPETIAVPALSQPPVWMVIDSWHLSLVSRKRDKILANLKPLSAPYSELVIWFKSVNDKVRSLKEDAALGKFGAAMAALRRRSVALASLGFVKDSGRLDPAVQDVGAFFRFAREAKKAYPMAYDILSSESDKYSEWQRAEGVMLGAISLEGSTIMNVPEASAATKIVMDRYITVKRDAFDHVHNVVERINKDVQLDKIDREHAKRIFRRRQMFVMKDVFFKIVKQSDREDSEPFLHILVRTPVNGQIKFMLYKKRDDNGQEFVQIKTFAISKTEKVEANEVLKVEGRNKDEQAEDEALRDLFVETERVGGTDAFVKGAQLVMALEQNQDSIARALSFYRDGIAEYYHEIAVHFQREHAPTISVDVVTFLLVLMLEDRTPYSGWLYRKIEKVLQAARKQSSRWLDDAGFETSIAAFMSAKAAFFATEGIAESWKEGISISSLIRGLSYGFTFFCVSEGGSFDFWGHSIIESVPELVALGPLYGAAKFGHAMLEHSKHGFDSVAELKRAQAASRVGFDKIPLKSLIDVMSALEKVFVVPWTLPLTDFETSTYEIDAVFGDNTFDKSPLGVFSASKSPTSVPVATLLPQDIDFGNVKFVCYSRKNSIMKITDANGFSYFFITKWKRDPDARAAESEFSCGNTKPIDARLFVENGHLKVAKGSSVTFNRPIRLFVSVVNEDTDLDQEDRIAVVMKFVETGCKDVSGVSGYSRLSYTLGGALGTVLIRALEILLCDDNSSPVEIISCLIKGEDGLPNFRSSVSTYAGKVLAIGDVTRDFCYSRPLSPK